jgi:hypothetical protein
LPKSPVQVSAVEKSGTCTFLSQVRLLVRLVVPVLVGKVWVRVLVRQGWVRGRVGLYR